MDLKKILAALAEDGANRAEILAQHLAAEGDPTKLAELITAATEQFETIHGNPEGVSESDINTLETLRDLIVGARGELDERGRRAGEMAARLAGLAEDIATPAEAEADEPDGDPDPEPDVEVPDTPESLADETPAPALTASRAPIRVRASQIPRSATPATNKTARRAYHLIAAADVPGVPAGSPITTGLALAEAIEGRFASMGGTARHQAGVAVIKRVTAPEFSVPDKAGNQEFTEIVDRVANETLLPGNSLIAAAGWCAPSETDYSLCPILEGLDHMVDLPTIGMNRGGLKYFSSPQFQQVYEGLAKQVLTEANLIANTPKTCIEAPCPTTTEVRMDALPLCIRADILQSRGYPEAVADFARRVQIAQQRFVNRNVIARMVAGSESATSALVPTRRGLSHQLLDELELKATWLRDLYHMSENDTMEVVLPVWARVLVRQDMAKRNAVGVNEVTNAMVDRHFAGIQVRVQWVRDWQDLATGTGGPPATFAPPATWPTSVIALMYPAGTWIKAERDVIRLDAVYDHASLTLNKFTALFSEDGLAVFRRCTRSLAITINGLCVSGAMGPNLDICPAPV